MKAWERSRKTRTPRLSAYLKKQSTGAPKQNGPVLTRIGQRAADGRQPRKYNIPRRVGGQTGRHDSRKDGHVFRVEWSQTAESRTVASGSVECQLRNWRDHEYKEASIEEDRPLETPLRRRADIFRWCPCGRIKVPQGKGSCSFYNFSRLWKWWGALSLSEVAVEGINQELANRLSWLQDRVDRGDQMISTTAVAEILREFPPCRP